VEAKQLSVYRHGGFWMGMDTAHEFTLLNDLWKSGQPPWRIWDV
jgi:glucose-1-phosphate cytidylyltransferase